MEHHRELGHETQTAQRAETRRAEEKPVDKQTT